MLCLGTHSYNIVNFYTVEIELLNVMEEMNQQSMSSLDTNADMKIEELTMEDLTMEESEIEKDEFLNSKNIEKEFGNDLLNNALHYATIGYPVLPVHNLVEENGTLRCSCQQWRTCDKQGKHPRTEHGYKDATTDENRIIDSWEKYPEANIGLLTGIESGILVLDIDIKYAGEYSLEDLEEYYRFKLKDNFDPLPATLTTNTGSGGRHLYFKYPLDLGRIKGSVSQIGSGLDIRANGNYIIVPPSRHLSGNKYQWLGVNTPIEDAPNWLIYEIIIAEENEKMGASSSSSLTSPKLAKSEKIKEGGRDIYLFKQVSGLVNSFPKEEVLRRAHKINEEQFTEPLKDKEILRIVNWAWKKYGRADNNDMGIKE